MTSLSKMIKNTFDLFPLDAEEALPTRWQGKVVKGQPSSRMMEQLHVNLEADMTTSMSEMAEMIDPNLPWADDHFEERVSGLPMNPGTQWKLWSHGINAEKSLDSKGQFNHNYMERFWPQYAELLVGTPTVDAEDVLSHFMYKDPLISPKTGIRHNYGDLAGLVRDLAKEPDTRQAYLPVWFPEDTGDAHKGRKPCTLGYHFIMRKGKLDIVYYMRSCDLANHFRDDVYLAVKLAGWVLRGCRELNPEAWRKVHLGKLVMQITNLHMFINDFHAHYPEYRDEN